jgi:hypothetical protein
MATKKTKIVKSANKGGVFSRQVTKSGPTAPPIPADSGVRIAQPTPSDPLGQKG